MAIAGFGAALRAFAILAAAAIVVGLFARIVAQPVLWLPIYDAQYSFTPGSRMANKLIVARENSAQTCVLLGASTVREGFDTNLIYYLTGVRTVNLGTTGGKSAVDTLEIQSRILKGMGDRYRCIVVGLHPMFLRSFDSGAYDILSTEYEALLPASALFDMTVAPWSTNPIGQLAYRFLLPAGQYADQLRRIARSILFRAHVGVFGGGLALSDFEAFEGELIRSPEHFYPPGSILKRIQADYGTELEKSGWANARLYGHLPGTLALQRTMQTLSKLTERLIVVEMPQSFLLDSAEDVSRPAYEAALRGSGVPLQAIRCAIPRNEQYNLFYDDVHLNSAGRDHLSRAFAQWLSSTEESSANSLCREREVLP